MLTTYTLSQMVSVWRQRAGLMPARTDCSIEAEDGIDIDALLQAEIRKWQLRMLDTADPAMLGITDIAARCVVGTDLRGRHYIILPDDCRRVVSVRMASWLRPVTPMSPEQSLRRMQLAANPYGAPGPAGPLAVAYPGRLDIFPGETRISSLKVVIDPGPETITVDESLLPSGKNIITETLLSHH